MTSNISQQLIAKVADPGEAFNIRAKEEKTEILKHIPADKDENNKPRNEIASSISSSTFYNIPSAKTHQYPPSFWIPPTTANPLKYEFNPSNVFDNTDYPLKETSESSHYNKYNDRNYSHKNEHSLTSSINAEKVFNTILDKNYDKYGDIVGETTSRISSRNFDHWFPETGSWEKGEKLGTIQDDGAGVPTSTYGPNIVMSSSKPRSLSASATMRSAHRHDSIEKIPTDSMIHETSAAPASETSYSDTFRQRHKSVKEWLDRERQKGELLSFF